MEDDDLEAETFAIRFGHMRLDDLREAVDRCFTTLGFYGLSFYGEDRLSVTDIAELAQKPHSFLRKAKVGQLREIGFGVQRRGRFPHLTLTFPERPTDLLLETLADVFDDPEPNPHPVK